MSQFKAIITIILLLLATHQSEGANQFRIDDDDFYNLVADENIVYILRLYSGDIIKGHITEFTSDPKKGEGVKLETYAGSIEIFHDQIIHVTLLKERNRHEHREYIMPTARPIGDDHFVGNWELALLYGGFGVYDLVSVTGGITLVPGVAQQAWVVNAKATVWSNEFEEGHAGGAAAAVGYNVADIGGVSIQHVYANASFWGERTNFTAMIFGRANKGRDEESFVLFDTRYPINLEPGAVGIGFGMDTRFSSWTDIRFVGELWSPDLSAPTQSAVMAGLRLDNKHVSFDAGLMFVTSPILIPYFAFSWTPF